MVLDVTIALCALSRDRVRLHCTISGRYSVTAQLCLLRHWLDQDVAQVEENIEPESVQIASVLAASVIERIVKPPSRVH